LVLTYTYVVCILFYCFFGETSFTDM
jgi:hypothetical protein